MTRSNQRIAFAGRCLLFFIGAIGLSTGVLAQAIPGFPPLEIKVPVPPTPLPLSSEGLPYVIDAYERVGMCEGRDCTIGPAQKVTGKIPLRDEIVVFPE